MFKRFWIPFLVLLVNGLFIGWGATAGILLVCSGIFALVGLAIVLSFRDDRLAQIFFAALSLTPVVGYWVGFLLHKVW